jgi:hypothetical protein
MIMSGCDMRRAPCCWGREASRDRIRSLDFGFGLALRKVAKRVK